MAWPPRFLFIAGRLCLDFVHTGGQGFRARWERWHTPQDLAEWMEACPLLAVRARVTAADLADAGQLREAIWEAAQAHLRGKALPAKAAALIETVAARPDLVPVLRQGKRAWSPRARGAQALSAVARDAIALFGTDAVDRLRECARHNCYLLFVDLSRGGRRAWCTMRRCGNLQKIARYRAARKPPASDRPRPAPRRARRRTSQGGTLP
jgi:predicted RNA-binding Zn ribbon-like protein